MPLALVHLQMMRFQMDVTGSRCALVVFCCCPSKVDMEHYVELVTKFLDVAHAFWTRLA